MQISGSAGAVQASQVRERLFSRADSDRSGGLSLGEFTAMAQRRAGPAAANSAGGATGAAQANHAVQDAFRLLDRDNDGNLSPAELSVGRPPRNPPATGGGFQSDTFTALLAGQESEARRGSSPNLREAGQPNARADAMLQRLLAAYQARQAGAAAGAMPAA